MASMSIAEGSAGSTSILTVVSRPVTPRIRPSPSSAAIIGLPKKSIETESAVRAVIALGAVGCLEPGRSTAKSNRSPPAARARRAACSSRAVERCTLPITGRVRSGTSILVVSRESRLPPTPMVALSPSISTT